MIDGKPALLDVLDTAGQEEYASLQDQWIREGDGYLIVYSITSADSLEEAGVLREKIVRIRDTMEFPVVLAGNKCDLESERKVTQEAAKAKVEAWNKQRRDQDGKSSVEFFETSAKTCQNTEEAFHTVVRCIRKTQAAETSKNGGKKKSFKCTIL